MRRLHHAVAHGLLLFTRAARAHIAVRARCRAAPRHAPRFSRRRHAATPMPQPRHHASDLHDIIDYY